GQLSNVPEARHLGSVPSGIASSKQSGTPAGSVSHQRVPRSVVLALARTIEEYAGWRRELTRPFAGSLRQRNEQQQHSQSRSAAGTRRWWRGRQDEGRSAFEVSGKHADGELA